jgi:hypothetical protein
MPGSLCRQGRETREEFTSCVSRMVKAIEGAPAAERIRLVNQALVELNRIRLAATLQLPGNGCRGRRCLDPAFFAAAQSLEEIRIEAHQRLLATLTELPSQSNR